MRSVLGAVDRLSDLCSTYTPATRPAPVRRVGETFSCRLL